MHDTAMCFCRNSAIIALVFFYIFFFYFCKIVLNGFLKRIFCILMIVFFCIYVFQRALIPISITSVLACGRFNYVRSIATIVYSYCLLFTFYIFVALYTRGCDQYRICDYGKKQRLSTRTHAYLPDVLRNEDEFS